MHLKCNTASQMPRKLFVVCTARWWPKKHGLLDNIENTVTFHGICHNSPKKDQTIYHWQPHKSLDDSSSNHDLVSCKLFTKKIIFRLRRNFLYQGRPIFFNPIVNNGWEFLFSSQLYMYWVEKCYSMINGQRIQMFTLIFMLFDNN